MKKYNVNNYIRYKNDIEDCIERIGEKRIEDMTRDELIISFMPMVENIAKQFSTTEQASGVLSINDLIQSGAVGLTLAADKVDWATIRESNDSVKTLQAFLSKRIRGAIRRAIDINRGDMRIPEHKLNEIRKSNGEDKKIVEMFFNSIFLSIDNQVKGEDDDFSYEIPDNSQPYNIDIMNKYLLSIMKEHLNDREYDIIRMSYGLDCDKMSAKDIASRLDIKGTASYVRVSQIKKEAIDKLIESVDPVQVVDFM